MSTKRCPSCGETKSVTQFGKNRAKKNGLATYCKTCHNRIIRSYKDKAYGGEAVFLRGIRYGISKEEFDALFDAQKGLCAICLDAPAEHVDHDHKSKKVRGLLCFNCNGALGKFNDDPELIAAAIEYLDRAERRKLDRQT